MLAIGIIGVVLVVIITVLEFFDLVVKIRFVSVYEEFSKKQFMPAAPMPPTAEMLANAVELTEEKKEDEPNDKVDD